MLDYRSSNTLQLFPGMPALFSVPPLYLIQVKEVILTGSRLGTGSLTSQDLKLFKLHHSSFFIRLLIAAAYPTLNCLIFLILGNMGGLKY